MRGARVRKVLTGNFDVSFRELVAEGEEPVVPNILHAAWRSFTHQIGQFPRVMAFSKYSSGRAQERKEKHEKAIRDRLEAQGFRSLMSQGASWYVAHGMLPVTLTMDPKLGHSRIMFRDPLTCYPSTIWPNMPHVGDCVFITRYNPAELCILYPEAKKLFSSYEDEVRECEVTELVTNEATYVSLTSPEAYLLDTIPNKSGKAQVYIARDITPDLDFHGQFDQLVPILLAQARLMALVQAYAEQQVAAETNIIGEISSNQGRYAVGPGAVNVIQPMPGARVEKLTNNMSPQIFQEIDRFERGLRVGGTFPAILSGEPAATVSTGRGIEKLSESVDFEVSSKQEALAAVLSEVFDSIPDFEAANGISEPRFAKDVSVQASFAFGASPVNAVRIMQLKSVGMMSNKRAMDQVAEIDDAHEESQQIEIEKLRDALGANLQAQAAQGQADPGLLVELIKQIDKGESIENAYAAYQEATAAKMAEAMAAMGALGGGGGVPPVQPSPGVEPTEQPSFQALLGTSSTGQNFSGVQGRAPIPT